jgi:hypothetical protein
MNGLENRGGLKILQDELAKCGSSNPVEIDSYTFS